MADWDVDDLHRRLDEPLGDDPVSRRRTLHVVRVVARGAALELDVVVSEPAAQVHAQRWRLTFATMGDDVRGLTLDAARIVTRANLEEWWDTRHSGEPWAGLTAARLSSGSFG